MYEMIHGIFAPFWSRGKLTRLRQTVPKDAAVRGGVGIIKVMLVIDTPSSELCLCLWCIAQRATRPVRPLRDACSADRNNAQ